MVEELKECYVIKLSEEELDFLIKSQGDIERRTPNGDKIVITTKNR